MYLTSTCFSNIISNNYVPQHNKLISLCNGDGVFSVSYEHPSNALHHHGLQH